jgi:multidrug efflux pump subunit AcrA (membrane-fusion protein)
VKRVVAAVAAVAVVAGGSWYAGSRSGGDGAEADGGQVIIRRDVDRTTLRDVVTLQGELLRDELQVINSPVDGRIASVEVADGDDVAPGDTLFVLDGRAAVAVNGAFSFFRPLDVGSDGPDVLQLETILSEGGYDVGPVDRMYTEATRQGLAAWQVDHGYGGATPEPVETVTVALQQNQAGYTIGAQNTAAVTIGPSVPAAGPQPRRPRAVQAGVPTRRVEVTAGATEVDEGAAVTFTFTVDTPFASDTSVAIVTGGDAVEDDDYDSLPSSVLFPAGASSVGLVVTTLEDDVLESVAEEVTIGISSDLPPEPLYTLGGRSEATVLIRPDGGDERTTVDIEAGSARVAEGSSTDLGGFGGASSLTFTISSALELNEDLEVRYRLGGNTVLGDDYLDPDDDLDGPEGVVVLPAGDTEVDLSIDLRDDDRVEFDETLTVTLVPNPDLTEFDPNYLIAAGRDRASTIVESDDVPELTLRGGGAIGEGGATSLVVRADQAPVEDTSVNFSVNGSAQAGDDFQALTGTVLLRAGQTQVSIPISSLDDDVVFEPSDMIVASWPARIGTVEVDAGEFVPQGTPLMNLTEPIFTVRLYAAATQFSELTLGQEVEVELDAGDQRADGVIASLDDSASIDDAGNERYEGVVQIAGELAAVDGAIVSIDVVLDEAVDALAVPIAAVSQDASGNKEVRVIADDGTITRVAVETGLEDGALIEITSGLEGDEIVVVEVDPS